MITVPAMTRSRDSEMVLGPPFRALPSSNSTAAPLLGEPRQLESVRSMLATRSLSFNCGPRYQDQTDKGMKMSMMAQYTPSNTAKTMG